MGTLQHLVEFLNELEKRKIFFKLNKIRNSILVEITVPGQRWEVEFMENGDVEIEKFMSNGQIHNENEIDTLFRDFTD